ncbi:ribosomal protein S18-alanine N-acetyltransferase [Sporichthya brevicatena]|uniref:[Ribosomal protein bS18]-alanine N-acetyltransferase n=1 Tax=Sporichthya brevicatena TaxID=171442 RepID=A0ABN1GLR1_9ACTN
MADLRPIRWWDVETLTAIEADLFGVDAWSAETFWGELAGIPETRWYRAAVEGEEIVGYVGLAAIDGTGDVQTVAVRRDRQGAGLGAVLLDALLTEAQNRGCSEVLLEVRADNPAAIRLYEKRAFERIAERPRYYADGVGALIMRRALDPAAAG